MNEQQKFRIKHVIIKAYWAQYIGSDSHRNLKIQEIQRRVYIQTHIHILV